MSRTSQQIFLIRRKADGLFLGASKENWVYHAAEAFLVSKTKFKGVVRADLGLDMSEVEMVEAVPSVML